MTRDKKIETIVRELLTFQHELKLYHWRTHSYARHKSSDRLYESFLRVMDQIVEALMGKYGKRIHLSSGKTLSLLFQLCDDTSMVVRLQSFQQFLGSFEHILDTEKDKTIGISDILTLRDELWSLVDQTLYLFTLS